MVKPTASHIIPPAFLPGSDSGWSGSAWQEHLEAPPKARVVPLRDIPSLAIDLLNLGNLDRKVGDLGGFHDKHRKQGLKQ